MLHNSPMLLQEIKNLLLIIKKNIKIVLFYFKVCMFCFCSHIERCILQYYVRAIGIHVSGRGEREAY